MALLQEPRLVVRRQEPDLETLGICDSLLTRSRFLCPAALRIWEELRPPLGWVFFHQADVFFLRLFCMRRFAKSTKPTPHCTSTTLVEADAVPDYQLFRRLLAEKTKAYRAAAAGEALGFRSRAHYPAARGARNLAHDELPSCRWRTLPAQRESKKATAPKARSRSSPFPPSHSHLAQGMR